MVLHPVVLRKDSTFNSCAVEILMRRLKSIHLYSDITSHVTFRATSNFQSDESVNCLVFERPVYIVKTFNY